MIPRRTRVGIYHVVTCKDGRRSEAVSSKVDDSATATFKKVEVHAKNSTF